MATTSIRSRQVQQIADYFGLDIHTLSMLLRQTEYPAITPTNDIAIADETILDALLALEDRLDEIFRSHDAVLLWLHSPSGYLGGRLPFDQLLMGRVDRVDLALDALEAGIFI